MMGYMLSMLQKALGSITITTVKKERKKKKPCVTSGYCVGLPRSIFPSNVVAGTKELYSPNSVLGFSNKLDLRRIITI